MLPRALADENGNPRKANKSTPTNFFKNRYCENNVITNEFPPNWMPDSVLLEGMFMIQTTPILGVVKFADYSKLLTHCYILPHFKNGVKEVHVIFDHHNTNTESPKEIEQQKRDKEHPISLHHEHANITETGDIPSNRRGDVLNCCNYKKTYANFYAVTC